MCQSTRRVRLRISGRVQGVFFRAKTHREAVRLSLHGTVRNLPDSGVEVVAEGPEDAVDALVRWCRRGPALARVDRVDIQAEKPTGERTGFSIVY